MLLKILIDHEFSDPNAFAMFATGYADLCKLVGITPANQTASARIQDKPAVIEPVKMPAPVEAASASTPAPQPDATPKRRGRPSAAEVAARNASTELVAGPTATDGDSAPTQAASSVEAAKSEPVKDAAPTATAPAARETPQPVTLDSVKAMLNALIMEGEGGEEIAVKIRSELFPGKKLAQLDGDTIAKVYLALVAAIAARG